MIYDPNAQLRIAGVLLLGVVFSVLAAFLYRRNGPRAVWLLFGAVVVVLVGYGVVHTRRVWPELGPVWLVTYMAACFWATPLAAVATVVGRLGRGHPERSAAALAAQGFLVFLPAVLLGGLLAFVPHVVRFFMSI